MLIEIEQVRSSLINAAGQLDGGREVREWNVSALKNLVGRVGHLVAEECIQMHGGIGMTDEHDMGLYIKRSRVAERTFGSAAYHHDHYASLNGY